jgi:hypothetical protein
MSTIYTRRDVESLTRAVVMQYNALHQATTATTVDGYHRDISGIPAGDFRFPTSSNLQVTAANGTTLATTITLALNIQGVQHVEFLDEEAHLKVDATNTALDGYSIDNTSAATQLSSVIIMLNVAKSTHNAHLTQSGVHRKNDTANAVATVDATDLTSAETLANAIKTAKNAHIISGPTVGRVRIIAE